MKDNGRWRGFIAVALLVLTAGTLAAQDVYLETSVEMPSPPGQQAPRQGQVKMWSSADKTRIEQNLTRVSAVITRKDLGKRWVINDAAKTYIEQPLAPPDDAATAALMSAANIQVDIKATGNTKKIGEWNCQEYVLTVSGPMPMVMQIWASPDVKIDTASFYAKMSEGPGRNPMMGPMVEKMRTITGYPVQTITKVMMGEQAMEMTSTLQKVSLENIDPALFELPAGYAKRELPVRPTPGAAPASPGPTPGAAPASPGATPGPAPAAPGTPAAPTPKKGSS
jgi:hypothetical protein